MISASEVMRKTNIINIILRDKLSIPMIRSLEIKHCAFEAGTIPLFRVLRKI